MLNFHPLGEFGFPQAVRKKNQGFFNSFQPKKSQFTDITQLFLS